MGINTYAIVALIAGMSSFSFGLFVYLENRKDSFNKLYALLSVGFFIWTLSYFIWLLQVEESSALFWARMLNLGATLIPPLYLHWILIFLGLTKKRRWLIFSAYFVTAIFSIFSFSHFYIKEAKQVLDFSYWPQAGPLYTIFLFTSYIGFVGYAFIELIRRYKKAEVMIKIKIRYLIGATILGFGGGATNFPLMYNFPLMPPYGMFLVIFYPFFFYYAIAKSRLFNVRVVLTELFTFIICIILIAKALLSRDLNEMIINGSIFIVVGLFGILLVRSVSKEVRQREKMEQMAKELERAYEMEKEAKRRIEELGEAKTQFMLATQHHFRTPLTSINGYIDLILTGAYGKVSSKLKETVLKIKISTNRLIRVVGEVLDISQFQMGKKPIFNLLKTKIEPVVEEVLEELQFTAQSKNIYLKLEKPKTEIPLVSIDVEKMKVALFNIVDNAIKYTNEGGVMIKIKNQISNIKIIIQDTGIGITKEEAEALFVDIFERGEEAKKLFGTGRGIGLYVANQIIKGHGGKVWVESEGRGKGSTFYIELPVK